MSVYAAVSIACIVGLLALAGVPVPAAAESLRCGGTILGEGESKIAVLRACGEPHLKDAFCKPVTVVVPGYPGTTQVITGLPCVLVDEWFYDRGEGNLSATVRFELGVVQSIRYGRDGRR